MDTLLFNLPCAERKKGVIFCECSLPWNQPKPLTMTYVEWRGIAGIYSTGMKRANNSPDWPLETTQVACKLTRQKL